MDLTPSITPRFHLTFFFFNFFNNRFPLISSHIWVFFFSLNLFFFFEEKKILKSRNQSYPKEIQKISNTTLKPTFNFSKKIIIKIINKLKKKKKNHVQNGRSHVIRPNATKLLSLSCLQDFFSLSFFYHSCLEASLSHRVLFKLLSLPLSQQIHLDSTS